MSEVGVPQSIHRDLDRLFATGTLQCGEGVAKVLNISSRTLRRLGDRGKIRFRLKGTAHRQYAREDIEAYLSGDFQWAHISHATSRVGKSRHSSTTISSSGRRAPRRASGFTARQAREQRKRLIASKRRGESLPPSENSTAL